MTMANNPEFQMQGITFVIATPSGDAHALPFKLVLPDRERVEIQHSLKASYTVIDVILELRMLANNLELLITETPKEIDFPAAVTGEKV
jgi:hypothetical protein